VAEAIAPPDAEALLVAHLAAELAARSITARVASRVSNPRPAGSYIRVSLADTQQQTPRHFYSRLIVECWAPSDLAAAELARTTYALTMALKGEDAGTEWVGDAVQAGGPVNFPEPEVGPRYQFTVDLLIAGELI
jgi:hypothetical protein